MPNRPSKHQSVITVLGLSATLPPGVRVGQNSVVGAGSVVLKSVKSGKTFFGVPACSLAGPMLVGTVSTDSI